MEVLRTVKDIRRSNIADGKTTNKQISLTIEALTRLNIKIQKKIVQG